MMGGAGPAAGGVAHLCRLARANALANQRLHRACAGLTPAELVAERTAFFPTLRLTLNHILIVDWYYLDALEGGSRGPALRDEDEPFADLPALSAAQAAADRRLVAFCDGLDPEGFARTVTLERPTGRYVERVDSVLLHLFVHQVHHRGQVHAMLSGTSVAPPQLDEFLLDQDADLRAPEERALGLD
jgi:uncharacterized damage-inducible protein DinB